MRMDQEIEETVRELKRRNSLKTHPFHLAHVNYYCKYGSGRYLECEIALVEFSFVEGIRKTFHTLIYPGDFPLGYASEATEHARKTHCMPLPTDGFGREASHPEVLSNIKSFLVGANGDETHLPPLCTRPCDIDPVESVLWHMDGRSQPRRNAGKHLFRVYSVSKLFHEFRNATLGIPSAVILHPNFLAEHVLIHGALEFTHEISCHFHEMVDAMQHCSLSYVQHWSFLIKERVLWVPENRYDPRKALRFKQPFGQRSRVPGLVGFSAGIEIPSGMT
jgi:hypothetical protein